VHLDTLYPVHLKGELWAVGGVCRDITELKRAEAQAARETERAEALLRVANRLSGYFTLDELLNAVCEESRQALGLSGSAVLLYQPNSKDFSLAQSSGLSDSYKSSLQLPKYDTFRQLLRDDLFVVSDAMKDPDLLNYRLYVEHRVRTIVGTSIVYKDELLGCLIVHTENEPRVLSSNEVALLRGIADQAAQGIVSARLFDQLRSSQQRLEDLSKRLVHTQEVERRHLARELHDDIGQVLTMIKLNLQSIDRDGLVTQTVDSLEAGLDAVDDAIQRVRNLSRDLRPSVLDDLGLVPALRWFIDQQAQQAPFEAAFYTDVFEDRLPSNLENAYFRIVQEAMTNVLRHSQAESVSIELRQEEGALLLSIWDDGVGFDVERVLLDVAEGQSLGLLNMRERVLLIGGSFEVRSESGVGTEITVRTPLAVASGRPKIDPLRLDALEID
jgi:signal transduction histidine kinase